MKILSKPVRTALGTALAPLIVEDTAISTYEEYVQPTNTRPVNSVDVGGTPIPAYIVILNQTANDNSAKTLRNDEVSVQLQCTTVWPANKGNSTLCESIAEEAANILFSADGLHGTLDLPGNLRAWKGELMNYINLNYDTETNRVWITQMILTYSITQS